MPYAETSMLKAPMKPSPSLLYNNLGVSVGQQLVFAHTRQMCVIQGGTIVEGTAATVRRVESAHTDVIHSVRTCHVGDIAYVVVTTEAGIQVWDKTTTFELFSWALPDPDAQADRPQASFARGVAANVSVDGATQICFGSSLGNLHVLEIVDPTTFKAVGVFSHHKVPVTALASGYQSRRGKWQGDQSHQLVTGDEDGAIAVWDAASATAYKVARSITVSTSGVTALAVRGDLIIAARLDGTVQMIGLSDGVLRCEFAAHSRWVSALDVHPTKDIVASVAEDATVSVWTLPVGAAKVSSLLSTAWLNATLTGVCFCGPTSDDVAVLAYDTDEIRIFKA